MTDENIRRLAVVTGASSGIGLELARQFAEHDVDLIMAAEDPGITEAARAMDRDGGPSARPVRVDVATRDGVDQLYREIRADGRRPFAVAINAGVGVSGEFARQTDLGAELRLLALNVVSSVHLAKLVLPDMVAAGSGGLLFTSSILGLLPGPYEATYAASKAFLYSFAEALRIELDGTGVSVTALLPGATDTRFFERAGMQDTKLAEQRRADPADVAREGFEALMAGQDRVVAGSVRDKALAAAAKVTPATVKARLHGRLAKPGSGAEPPGSAQ